MKNRFIQCDLRRLKILSGMFACLILFTLPAFAMGKKGPFVQVDNQLAKFQAEEMSAMKADIAKMQNDAKVSASAIAGFKNKIEQINQTTSAGRDAITTTTNDTKLMREVLETYKDLTERYIILMKWIIGTLFFSTAFAMANLIGAIVWIVKFLLKRDKSNDEFMQEQIKDK